MEANYHLEGSCTFPPWGGLDGFRTILWHDIQLGFVTNVLLIKLIETKRYVKTPTSDTNLVVEFNFAVP